jgi:hypothetical protein
MNEEARSWTPLKLRGGGKQFVESVMAQRERPASPVRLIGHAGADLNR